MGKRKVLNKVILYSRMRDSREYLYISGNGSAKRKKSVIWERKGYVYRNIVLDWA